MNNIVCIIPARGGSKGLPGKNIKKLNGKPLITYTIDAAKALVPIEDIVFSTDCSVIKNVCVNEGLENYFVRPDYLATDEAGSHEVVLHALDELKRMGRIHYKYVALLQPTSPFRTGKHLVESFDIFSNNNCEMLTSVFQPEDSPYYNQFKENNQGHLEELLPRSGYTRQSCPPIYTYNGAIYIFKVNTIKIHHLHKIRPIKKFLMDNISSLQIDTYLDWIVAESIIKSEYNI